MQNIEALEEIHNLLCNGLLETDNFYVVEAEAKLERLIIEAKRPQTVYFDEAPAPN